MPAITSTLPNQERYTIEQFEQLFAAQIRTYLQTQLNCFSKEVINNKKELVRFLKQKYPRNTKATEQEIWQLIHTFVVNKFPPNKTLMHKNFGLTEIRFKEMIEMLEQGDNSLFEQIFFAHFQNCRLYLQSRYNASSEDAYDISMDTMLAFCKRLKAGKIKYGNLRFLFTQMAVHLYLKWTKKQLPQQPMEGIDLPDLPEVLDASYDKTLEKAWKELCDNCQNLLESFYYKDIELKAVAVQVNKSAAAVRKQKQRCVEKLQILFIKYNQ